MKKKSSLFIFLFITRVSNDFKVSSLLFLFLENSFILISMSHLRSMIISEESWKIFTSFLPALDFERIVSKSNRFEKYLKVVGRSGSTPGRGNNFPRNDCVMKAFNTGGVTLGSSPLEIRTVTLRDIWKGCNLRELRSTAELMCKLRHNSCSSRGSRLSIVGRRNFFLG